MCSVDDDSRADLWMEAKVKARKPHVCDVCRLVIAKGVVYDCIESLADGRWYRDRVHEDCHALAKYIQLELCQQHVYYLDGFELRSEVREHMFEYQDEKLIPMYRRLLRARIKEGVWPIKRSAA